MDDLISRQAAIEALGEEPAVWTETVQEIAERNQWRRDVAAIKAVQAVQPERKKGRWIRGNSNQFETQFVCSKCDARIKAEDEFRMLFCYHCGADMRGNNQ